MRLLRLALIPCVACVLSCSTQTEERSLTTANPVQPILGNPIAFPSVVDTTGVLATPTPTPKPSVSPTPGASATPGASVTPYAQTPVPTATAAAPTATPTGAAPTATPTRTPTPQATTAPTATPTPQSGLPPNTIHHIRVGFYGIDCPRGRTPPNNGAKLLPIGCRGFVTATPKLANGDDVPEEVHGPDIDWDLSGGQFVTMKDSKTSDWNKDLTGVRAGTFNLCATVRGITGCLDGTVIP